MSEIKKLPNEKWGPFVRRRDAILRRRSSETLKPW